MSDWLENARDAFSDDLRAARSPNAMAIAMLRFAITALEEELASGSADAERQEELRVHIASDKLAIRHLEKEEEAKARARFLN
jgi:hypothetical protein